MSQQSLRQASVRAVTSTTLTYEGDWHALFDSLSIADGQFNERLLAYINGYLSASYTELNGAMAAFAAEHGSTTFQAIGTFTPGSSLTAPVATWTSAATVAQAIFGLQAPLGVVSGDQIYGEASVNSDVSSPFDTEIAAISPGDLIDLVIEDFAFAAFTDGLKYCRFCIKNAGGTQISAWSNIISRTIAVLPVLSSPTDVSTGQTTADVGVTTDTAEGTLYCVVTTSATPPTKAQVKLGQDNSGVAATYAANQAITTTGVKAFSATGLTSDTAYTAHFMHEDVAGNQSTVSTANGFTTDTSATATTMNPADKGTKIDLTNGNLTVGFTGADEHQMARSVAGKSSGKWYYEVTIGSAIGYAPGYGFGIASAATVLNNNEPCGAGDENAALLSGGAAFNSGATIINDATLAYTTGDVIACRFDVDAATIGFRHVTDNSAWFDSSALASFDTPVHAMAALVLAADEMTFNFGPTFAGSVPSGYAALTN